LQAVNEAPTGQARAVYAKNYSEDGGQAIYGHAGGAMGENYGVYGKSDSETGGSAGVYGTSTYTGTESKVYGLYGYVNAANGRALQAVNEAPTGQARAVYAKNYSEDGGQAIYGHAGGAMGENYGVYGKSDSETGGSAGVYGTSTYTGTESKVYGLYGYVNAANGRALQAVNEAPTGQARAVYAKNYSEDGGQAIYGHAGGAMGENYGVYGKSDSETGGSAGVYGTSTYTGTESKVYGLYGYVNAANGRALQAMNEATTGQARAVYAKSMSTEGQAVYGHAGATSGENYGIYGKTDSLAGYGGYFTNTAGGAAGYFEGALDVSGTITSTDNVVEMEVTGYANNPVVHHSVNAPQQTNMYVGRVTLDASGEATVTLPDYFDDLNTDYTYQLTPIGGAAPNLHISSEVSNNEFAIAGGTDGLEVSWQVTGVSQ
jgi:hypothetical protein